MKKHKIFAAGLIMAGALMSSAHADCKSYWDCFTDKSSQGLFNVVAGVVEIPKNIVNISSDDNILVGVTWGTLRGALHTVGRTLAGGAELITAPFPTDPFVTPPYAWERFSEDTRYFGYHLPGYWTSYGPLDDGE
jgi:putative exosortase-associated protein (TIGR04073 family)